MNWKQRYSEAHLLWYKTNRPGVVSAGHYPPPVYPDVEKTSGIEKYCTNMIIFLGGNMTGTKAIARMTEKIVKTESGASFTEKRPVRSTRKGKADLAGGLRGKQIEIEVKNKYTRDTMKDHQWKEKERIEKGGGQYWIVTCVEDFLFQLDAFLYG